MYTTKVVSTFQGVVKQNEVIVIVINCLVSLKLPTQINLKDATIAVTMTYLYHIKFHDIATMIACFTL